MTWCKVKNLQQEGEVHVLNATRNGFSPLWPNDCLDKRRGEASMCEGQVAHITSVQWSDKEFNEDSLTTDCGCAVHTGRAVLLWVSCLEFICFNGAHLWGGEHTLLKPAYVFPIHRNLEWFGWKRPSSLSSSTACAMDRDTFHCLLGYLAPCNKLEDGNGLA